MVVIEPLSDIATVYQNLHCAVTLKKPSSSFSGTLWRCHPFNGMERGADLEGVLEKGELVRLAQERFAFERKVPAGYAFDAQSGYYYSHQDQLYLDPGSGYHYDGKEWFKKK